MSEFMSIVMEILATFGFNVKSLIIDEIHKYYGYQVQEGNFKIISDTISGELGLDIVRIVNTLVASIVSLFGGIAMEAFGTINGLSFKMMLLWKIPSRITVLSQHLERLVYFVGYLMYNFVMAVYFTVEAL